MNKTLIITLGMVAALSASTVSALADSIIYTDGIGRMHFLGRDAASNTGVKSNFSNSAEQDLTRKLYENSSNEVTNDDSYDQHPLKNYENTFPDSRFNTTKYWKTNYANNVDEARVQKASETVTGTTDIEKEAVNASNSNVSTPANMETGERNVIKATTKKKHWWSRD